MRKHALSLFLVCSVSLLLSSAVCHAQLSTRERSEYHVPRKGAIDLRANLIAPLFNWFYYTDTEYGKLSRVGFGYWDVGIDYYHHDKAFLNLTIGESYDLKLPAVITYGFGGKDSENILVLYCSLSNNHTAGRFSIGYGLSYGYDRWKMRGKISYLYSHSLGFVFPAYYYFNNETGFYVGTAYRPMFVQFSQKTRLQYQHTLSLILGFRLRVNKPK